ncbi:MAG: cyclic nucleotide-binding domain-containing protein [Myxococcaceae bacterium]|nr:cyclic nucleotide-binding domain-containing protein [Myxococcaceae bacterium]
MATSAPMLKKLSALPMCQGLSAAQTAELVEIAEETTAKKGATLFAEESAGDALYVVLEGQVEVSKRGASLAKLGEGSVLGEMSLLGGEMRSATVTALSECKLLRISTERFQKRLAADNLAALKVTHNLAQVMSRRLAVINDKLVESLGKTKKKEELADFGRILNNWSF